MIASGYTLDLYCEVEGNQHGYKEGQASFYGETWGDTTAQARAAGWMINRRVRECICPKCVAAGLRLTVPSRSETPS